MLQGYCVPGCAEDVIGFTFYKYILTNVVSMHGVEVLSAVGKKCLHMESYIDAPWVSAPAWVDCCQYLVLTTGSVWSAHAMNTASSMQKSYCQVTFRCTSMLAKLADE